jgi:hypothetical protein
MPLSNAQIDEFKKLNVTALDRRTGSATRNACYERISGEVVPALLNERRETLLLLRRLEWSATVAVDDNLIVNACPSCRCLDPRDRSWQRHADAEYHRSGHAPRCEPAAVLGH